MHKIKIRLPATITSLGPGLNSIGLALGLYTSVEVSKRTDEALVVETEGEGAGRFSIGLRHPVMLALIRMFQHLEQAPLGVTVKVNNQIPLVSGLGAEAAFLVAGVIGANNLMGSIYDREQLLSIAAQMNATSISTPNEVITPVLGGLTASVMNSHTLIYRSLPLTSFKVVVVLPEVENYPRPVVAERVPLQDMVHNLNRVPLLLDALRNGDLTLLAQVLDDKLRAPLLTPNIPRYAEVAESARRAGALAVTVSGDGPALLAFAANKHEKVVDAMREAFKNAGMKARGWVLPVDTQGIVISVMQSA
jgi:homoserine kinase